MTKKFHPNSINSLKHGYAIDWQATPEYWAWCSMKARCFNANNKKYPLYGGRGISVCAEWRNDFLSFFAHVGKRPSNKHSLDRIDGNRGYEPGNVRWATAIEQNRNRKNARVVSVGDAMVSLIELSEQTGVKYTTICKRWRVGDRDYQSITRPADEKKSNTKARQVVDLIPC